MTMSASLLQEFDQEMAIARKVIERLPEDKYDWAPHKKSMTAGRLASHIADMIGWVPECITQDSLDLAARPEPFCATSRAELLAAFDKNVADAHRSIEGTSDEALMKPWSALKGEQTLITVPRIVVIGTFVTNHIIHHRGQLSVYLRLTDTPVPSIYGPSADEGI
jgi:uncharacterized damage-inducible protein DinB